MYDNSPVRINDKMSQVSINDNEDKKIFVVPLSHTLKEDIEREVRMRTMMRMMRIRILLITMSIVRTMMIMIMMVMGMMRIRMKRMIRMVRMMRMDLSHPIHPMGYFSVLCFSVLWCKQAKFLTGTHWIM